VGGQHHPCGGVQPCRVHWLGIPSHPIPVPVPVPIPIPVPALIPTTLFHLRLHTQWPSWLRPHLHLVVAVACCFVMVVVLGLWWWWWWC
jgi:hypothetical protein